jgi:hypothetical protein
MGFFVAVRSHVSVFVCDYYMTSSRRATLQRLVRLTLCDVAELVSREIGNVHTIMVLAVHGSAVSYLFLLFVHDFVKETCE